MPTMKFPPQLRCKIYTSPPNVPFTLSHSHLHPSPTDQPSVTLGPLFSRTPEKWNLVYTAKHGSFAEHVLIFIFNREMCDFYSTLEALKTPNLLHPCGVTCGLELWKSDLNSRALVFQQIWGFVCLAGLVLVFVC